MRRQRQLRHDRRSETQQFDLFARGSGGCAAPTPEWRTLPAPTRQALTALMMLLIFDGWWRTSASVRSELWRPGRSRALPVTRPAITFPNRGRRAMMSEKIRPHHLERKAILYVRQSSAYQVLRNRESSALQYAMRDRLIALGWSEIETVDDDLGRSAAGGVARAGFEREGRPRPCPVVHKRKPPPCKGEGFPNCEATSEGRRLHCLNRRSLASPECEFWDGWFLPWPHRGRMHPISDNRVVGRHEPVRSEQYDLRLAEMATPEGIMRQLAGTAVTWEQAQAIQNIVRNGIRQIGNRLAPPAVLELKVLQAFHLLGLQPTKLLAPPIIRHLAHADLADSVHHVLALRDQSPRVTDVLPQPPPRGDRLGGVLAMFVVAVVRALGSARSRRATMHPAPPSPGHGRRPARRFRACLGATASRLAQLFWLLGRVNGVVRHFSPSAVARGPGKREHWCRLEIYLENLGIKLGLQSVEVFDASR